MSDKLTMSKCLAVTTDLRGLEKGLQLGPEYLIHSALLMCVQSNHGPCNHFCKINVQTLKRLTCFVYVVN